MIANNQQDPYKNITKVSIIDKRKVFYPLRYQLQQRDIIIDESECLTILPLPEDIKYPAAVKTNDAGTLWEYKVEISTNNQSAHTLEQLMRFLNRKVIVVLHHPAGRIILGCNELPLIYRFTDDNSTNPATVTGCTIQCTGNSYFPKVMR